MHLLLSDPAGYKSASQRARVATERWATENLYCPACDSPRLEPKRAGLAVTDFECPVCGEGYQLKGKRGSMGARIRDAAFSEALRAAQRNEFPHLLVLGYARIPGRVITLQAIPGSFVTPAALEPSKPLSSVARRTGWIGCNIVIADLPQSARVTIVESGQARPPFQVRTEWRRWNFLKTRDVHTRTWFTEILRRVEGLGKQEFTLNEVYAFEEDLVRLFPNNRFIRPKIRQQLQVLRDRGFLEFHERGRYRYLPHRK